MLEAGRPKSIAQQASNTIAQVLFRDGGCRFECESLQTESIWIKEFGLNAVALVSMLSAI